MCNCSGITPYSGEQALKRTTDFLAKVVFSVASRSADLRSAIGLLGPYAVQFLVQGLTVAQSFYICTEDTKGIEGMGWPFITQGPLSASAAPFPGEVRGSRCPAVREAAARSPAERAVAGSRGWPGPCRAAARQEAVLEHGGAQGSWGQHSCGVPGLNGAASGAGGPRCGC